MNLLTDDPATIAGRFLSARRAAAGLADYPGDFPETLDEAYAVQDAAIAAWGRPVLGWKVGRINPPLSERFGTDRLAGPIFASRAGEDAAVPHMPVFAKGFAAGEAEFLLRIAASPAPGKTSFSLAEAADLSASRLRARRSAASTGLGRSPSSPTSATITVSSSARKSPTGAPAASRNGR